MLKTILDISPANYNKHFLHHENKIWTETNCYTDLIIELLHSYQFDPTYALAFTLALDFEGDQWGFFKFHHIDLYELFNIEIDEYTLWKPLVEHIEFQVSLKRQCLVELDSFFLPDTNGTAYKMVHTKSTVSINKIDVENKRMEYFHNQGYFQLAGEDFDNILQINGLIHERMLPPYFEIMKINAKDNRSEKELLNISLLQLKKHLNRVSSVNPFIKFKEKFIEDFEWLKVSNLETFHVYSFANLRQYGACFELAGIYLNFLDSKGLIGMQEAANKFLAIANDAKTFQFQLARCIARKKEIDMTPIDGMAKSWEEGINLLSKFK